MGTWGEKLFDDDTARDVRDEYRRQLPRKGTPEGAIQEVLEEQSDHLREPDEGPVIWLALAVTEHKMGYATPRVIEEARRVLEEKLGLERWREMGPAAERARLKEYARIQALLDSPRPASKPIKVKKVHIIDSGLRAGDVFRLPIGASPAAADHFAYFCVVWSELDKDTDEVTPIVCLLDFPPPNREMVSFSGFGRREFRELGSNRRVPFIRVSGWKARGPLCARVERAGNVATIEQEIDRPLLRHCGWDQRLLDYAKYSFDDSEWATAEVLRKRLKAMTAEQIVALGESLLKEVDKPYLGVHTLWSVASYLIKWHKFSQGLAVYDVAIRADPTPSSELIVKRGNALFGLGRIREAESEWQRGLEAQGAAARVHLEEEISWAKRFYGQGPR